MAADPSNNNGAFENPDGQPDAGGSERFAAPDSAHLEAEVADQQAAAAAAGFGDELLALKAAIEERLTQKATESAQAAAVQSIDDDNIVGVGFGEVDAEDLAAGASGLPGDPALAVFTLEPMPPERLQVEVAGVAGTRASSAVPIVQIPTGVVDALSHRFRLRPAPGGVSVGHFRITAGTIGCLATGNSAPRSQRLMVLSNNHVLANTNDARLGDCICQPGPADGGRCPGDQIAILERFVPINFSAGSFNFVDCATGWAWPDRVRRELVYLSGGAPVFFRVGAAPAAPAIGMIVGKTGRTTQLRQGRITAVGVTVNVNFGGGRVAQFRDQISIRGLNGDFSAGGDSGSLVWQWATGLRPVGLLFAGGGGTTFANRITRVLSALDVRMVV